MKDRKNLLEWSVFAVGLLLILASLAYLVNESISGGKKPADIQVEAGTATHRHGGYAVPLRIRNSGDETAEEVLIRAELRNAGEILEEVDLHLPYVPRASEREAVIVLRRNPAQGRLDVRVISFQKP